MMHNNNNAINEIYIGNFQGWNAMKLKIKMHFARPYITQLNVWQTVSIRVDGKIVGVIFAEPLLNTQ